MRELRDRRVLVTGAARGIGRALGARFGAAGARVLLTDLDGAALADTISALRADGIGAEGHALDVTDLAAIEQVRARIEQDGGPVDVLVNNAGVVFGGPFLDVPLELHLRTFEVNVKGLVAVTRAFLPGMLTRPRAHLVQMASASGFVGLPYGSTYAASKWAVIGFADSLRQELRLDGHTHVGVTTVCPSYVDTGLFDGARPPRTTRVLTPERLAEMVLRAVRGNRPYLLTPWLIKVTPFIKGALPTWLSDRLGALVGATTSMEDWRGRG